MTNSYKCCHLFILLLGDNIKALVKRTTITFYVLIFLFLICLIKIGYLQFIKGSDYTEKAFELWTRQVPISGKRGNIYDRNKKLIAGSRLAPSVYIIPSQIEDKEYTINTISTILDISTSYLDEYFNKKVSITSLGSKCINIDISKAKQLIAKNLKGVYISSDTVRYYPYGDRVLSNVLGIVGKDNIGLSGVEYIYNDILLGKKSSNNIFTDSHGNTLENMDNYYTNNEKNIDIFLTIDIDIQLSLESILDNVSLNYDPLDAISIVLDPKTSEVLAMSQRPNFEISNYQNYDEDIYNRNLAIWKNFEPGSTFKIMTFSSALNENLIKLTEPFYCKGYTMIDKTMVKDWKKTGHGQLDFCGVLQNSCNPGLMEIGSRLGKNKLFDYFYKFGFGQKTNIDLLGESKGILLNLDNVGPLEVATSSFGQANAVTAIQIINAVSCSINGGSLHKPYILKAISINNNTFYTKEKTLIRQVITKETSEKMRYALETVCSLGTGRSSYIDCYRVGGKTGTSQVVENGQYSNDRFILSFIGALPMNDPQVICYMAIDKPKSYIQYGGVIVAPLVKEVLLSSITKLEIPPQDNQIEIESRYWVDKFIYKVDNYIGLEIDKIKLNPHYRIKIEGSGNKVISQTPSYNQRITEGGVVTLYT